MRYPCLLDLPGFLYTDTTVFRQQILDKSFRTAVHETRFSYILIPQWLGAIIGFERVVDTNLRDLYTYPHRQAETQWPQLATICFFLFSTTDDSSNDGMIYESLSGLTVISRETRHFEIPILSEFSFVGKNAPQQPFT